MSTYSNLYKRIQEAEKLPEFAPMTLSEYFKIPSDCFIEMDDDPNVILAYKRHKDRSAEGYLLKGTFFFKRGRRIIRGYPKILYGYSHQSSIPFACQAEHELLSCLKNSTIDFEEKVDGINIRMYKHEGKYYFATRKRFDGSPRIGDIQWGEIAKRIIDSKYPEAYNLVDSGLIPVFEIVSPIFDFLHINYNEEDAFLIDIMDKNHYFLERKERERIAEAKGFRLPELLHQLTGSIPYKQFKKIYRSYEHHAALMGLEGMVAKSRKIYEDGTKGDQIFLKIKNNEIRKVHRGYSLPKRYIDAVVLKVTDGMKEEELQDLEYIVALAEEDLEEEFGISKTLTNNIKRSAAEKLINLVNKNV